MMSAQASRYWATSASLGFVERRVGEDDRLEPHERGSPLERGSRSQTARRKEHDRRPLLGRPAALAVRVRQSEDLEDVSGRPFVELDERTHATTVETALPGIA
jgi:hypothetical protein